MNKALLKNVLLVITLSLMSMSCYAQKSETNSKNPPLPLGVPNREINEQGWKRYHLESKSGNVIGVFLPRKPDEFPGGKLRVSATESLPVDLFIVSENEEFYAVVFVSDLPAKSEQMAGAQKADIFSGCWKAVIGQVRQVLERKSGAPVEVKGYGQVKVNVSGREGMVEDFIVGPYFGHARMLFAERRAYMLVGLWPENRAKERRESFLDTFEMRIKS